MAEPLGRAGPVAAGEPDGAPDGAPVGVPAGPGVALGAAVAAVEPSASENALLAFSVSYGSASTLTSYAPCSVVSATAAFGAAAGSETASGRAKLRSAPLSSHIGRLQATRSGCSGRVKHPSGSLPETVTPDGSVARTVAIGLPLRRYSTAAGPPLCTVRVSVPFLPPSVGAQAPRAEKSAWLVMRYWRITCSRACGPTFGGPGLALGSSGRPAVSRGPLWEAGAKAKSPRTYLRDGLFSPEATVNSMSGYSASVPTTASIGSRVTVWPGLTEVLTVQTAAWVFLNGSKVPV